MFDGVLPRKTPPPERVRCPLYMAYPPPGTLDEFGDSYDTVTF